MGYEVVYHYHEEIEKGEYNKEETRQDSVKVGDPFDDVSLDILAGKVMALLARRSILVVDVEIYQLAKKKLSFKEAKDGIVIKNKKFKFDDGSSITGEQIEKGEEDPEALLARLLEANPELLKKISPAAQVPVQTNLGSSAGNPQANMPQTVSAVEPLSGNTNNLAVANFGKPLRYELFNPVDKMFFDDAKKRGLKFTLNQKYPIYHEKSGPNQMVGCILTTVDDTGQKQLMSERFFTPDIRKLEKDVVTDPFGAAAKVGGDPLEWSNVVSSGDVPNLRG